VPSRGGTRADLARIFDVPPACIRCRRRRFAFRYRSAAHWVQVFRDFDGPVHKAFERLNLAQQQALERELTTLLEAANTAGPGSLVVPAEYLEAVIRPTRLESSLTLAQPH
jgi:hypothetical protein